MQIRTVENEFDESKKNLKAQLVDRLKDGANKLADLKIRLNEEFQKLAGPQLETMLLSREMTETFIKDLDVNLKCSAIWLLIHHWGPCKESATICEELAVRDALDSVRAIAISGLGKIYWDTQDLTTGKLLAGIVDNPSETIPNRQQAYFSLLGVWKPSFIVNMLNIVGFRFPEDVDWEFVSSFGEIKE